MHEAYGITDFGCSLTLIVCSNIVTSIELYNQIDADFVKFDSFHNIWRL